MQLLFETENASIKFNPKWPQLDGVDGLFMVDSGNLVPKLSRQILIEQRLKNQN